MSFGLSAAAIGGIVSAGAGIVSGVMSANAAKKAAAIQGRAAEAGIEEQARQFDVVRELLKPYTEAGTKSLSGQQDLLGLNGPDAAAAAIEAIQAGPRFTALRDQGEASILANASATGGLRGGNVQGALAQFSPNLLAQLIQQQFSDLGSITNIGQNAAAGTGNAAINAGNQTTKLLEQQGAAQAGGVISANKGYAQIPAAIGQGFGVFTGMGGTF